MKKTMEYENIFIRIINMYLIGLFFIFISLSWRAMLWVCRLDINSLGDDYSIALLIIKFHKIGIPILIITTIFSIFVFLILLLYEIYRKIKTNKVFKQLKGRRKNETFI